MNRYAAQLRQLDRDAAAAGHDDDDGCGHVDDGEVFFEGDPVKAFIDVEGFGGPFVAFGEAGGGSAAGWEAEGDGWRWWRHGDQGDVDKDGFDCCFHRKLTAKTRRARRKTEEVIKTRRLGR